MHPGSGRVKVTAGVVATAAVVLLWGVGVEYVLHTYVFVSPPESLVQKIR